MIFNPHLSSFFFTLLGIGILFSLPAVIPIYADPPGNNMPQCEDINFVAEEALRDLHLAGLSVAVVHRQNKPYAKGFGFSNIETRQPITADSLFHTASISKLFTATALKQLADTGRIDLDAPVTHYLSYFPFRGSEGAEAGSVITIRQALSHCSGIPDVEDYEWDQPRYGKNAPEEYVRSLEGMELIDQPGKEFHYSNMAYDILGQLITEVSDLEFETHIHNSILSPLRMTSSSFLYSNFDKNRLTSPHIRTVKNPQNEQATPELYQTYPYNRIHAPSSTLASTANDMNRWMMANLNGGEMEGHRILKETAYDDLWNCHTVIRDNTWVGLSWFHTVYKDMDLYYHSGGDTGYSAVCILVPGEKLGVTVMTNTDQARVVSIALKIIDLYI